MIQLTDVGFAYRKRQHLFQHLNLTLEAGTICGLLGTNGAGKSTLLKLLAGLSFPQAGQCRVLGHEPAKREPDFLADVFLLPEELYLPELTATAYVARYAPLYPRFDRAVFAQLMQEFALPLDRKLTALSMGQRKKFALSFGMATNASLFLMDEPTNGLDIPGKQEFRRALLKHYSPERSFIISTHQVHDLQGLVDSVMIVANGRILLHESLETLSTTLSLEISHDKPDDALYVEATLEGFHVLRINDKRDYVSDVDLTLLFGCTLAQPELLRSLLAQNKQQEAA
jgi:ABC-2 type transport system ATP-binding protein